MKERLFIHRVLEDPEAFGISKEDCYCDAYTLTFRANSPERRLLSVVFTGNQGSFGNVGLYLNGVSLGSSYSNANIPCQECNCRLTVSASSIWQGVCTECGLIFSSLSEMHTTENILRDLQMFDACFKHGIITEVNCPCLAPAKSTKYFVV